MANDPFVSVVIPAYNVENYIEECIKSICDQTYMNLQICVVDDGSTDNTGMICDRLASEDQRITVIHQPNQGVVAARAAGVSRAKGKYISFVDGDDWIEPEMIKFMVDNIGSCQLVTTGVFREVNTAYQTIRNDEFDEGVYSGKSLEQLFSSAIYDVDKMLTQPLTPWLFNKLFETDLIKDIMINENPQLKYGEDSIALYQYLIKCSSICIKHKAFYHYRFREESAIHMVDVQAIDKITKVYAELLKCFPDERDPYNFIRQAQHWFVVVTLAAINERMGFAKDIHIPRYVPNTEELTGKRIVLYAAGRVGKDYYKFLTELEYEIAAWVDKHFEQYKDGEYQISSIDNIKNIEYDCIFIAVEKESAAKSISAELVNCGIGIEKIIWRKPVFLY